MEVQIHIYYSEGQNAMSLPVDKCKIRPKGIEISLKVEKDLRVCRWGFHGTQNVIFSIDVKKYI